MTLVEAHEPVLIGGAGGASGHLFDLLPDIVAARSVVVPALAIPLSDAALLPIIHDALIALDATMRMRRVTELRELALARGRAAIGYAPSFPSTPNDIETEGIIEGLRFPLPSGL